MGYVIHHPVRLSCDPLSALEPSEFAVPCPIHDPEIPLDTETQEG